MSGLHYPAKTKEWLRRYLPAELLGTVCSLTAAWAAYAHTHSFAAAAAAGWTGEGIGFYGYFLTTELIMHGRRYQQYPFFRRIPHIIAGTSTNLLIEFMPAEILDNFFIRPLVMYTFPQVIHPYPIGFLAAKFSADALFYVLAIIGYEARKRWVHYK